MIGQTLGHYQILDLLGRGGMGEVYRALDTQLDRHVALKLLPPEFAEDAERLARFRREARTLASLHHPNVASLFGLEEVEGRTFLTMELVEGEDLAARLDRGAVPVEEAIDVARQIAEGLEEAHEAGVVHRDLKPANVKVTREGRVKILDFGLARAYAGETTDEEDLANSPTITAAMTRPGVILGTAAYMSPEQARGKPVDRRADIWAFGVILFEMLTGEQLHAGETVSDTLARVLMRDPDWAKLPPRTPPHVERVLRRCLVKDPRQRLRDIGEARIRLGGRVEESGGIPDGSRPPVASARTWIPWTVAVLSLLAASLALWAFPRGGDDDGASASRVVRFSIPTAAPEDGGAGSPRVPGDWLDSRFLDISRDGTMLGFLVHREDGAAIALRRLDSTELTRIPAPDYVGQLFFSPDGARIAYVAETALQVVAIGGGPVNELAPSNGYARGGVWRADGDIILPLHTDSPLYVLEPRGSTPDTLTTLDVTAGERTHRWPDPLPDERGLLLTVGTEDILDFDEASLAVFDARDRSIHRLVQGTMGRYAPTGHLVYHRGGTLYAARFDLETLQITGESVPMLAGVMFRPVTGAAQYAFSDDGTLCFVPGGPIQDRTSLHWTTGEGELEEALRYPGLIQGIEIGPDGRFVALEIDAANANIWILDLDRDGISRLTFEGSNNFPRWDPSGETIYYSSARHGLRSIYRRPVDGGTSDELVVKGSSERGTMVFDLAPDGRSLCIEMTGRDANADLYRLSLDAAGELEPFLTTRFSEAQPSFSPDGRWVAYTSDETGALEVYVRRYPEGDRKKKVSAGGGSTPRWSPAGDAIYYVTDGSLMRVGVRQEPELALGIPEIFLGRGDPASSSRLSDNYDVTPDGKRLLVVRSEMPTDLPARIEVVLGWFGELERRVP